MNLKYCFTIFLLFFYFYSSAQTDGFYKGYMITLKGDTIHCYFENKFNYGGNVLYWPDMHKPNAFRKMKTINIAKLVHDTIVFEGIEVDGYNCLFLKRGDGEVKLFAKNYVEGPYNTLAFSAPVFFNGGFVSGPSRAGASITYYLKRNNDVFEVDPFTFKRDMSLYFKDYKELSDQIEKRVLTKQDMELIVKRYNEWYKNK